MTHSYSLYYYLYRISIGTLNDSQEDAARNSALIHRDHDSDIVGDYLDFKVNDRSRPSSEHPRVTTPKSSFDGPGPTETKMYEPSFVEAGVVHEIDLEMGARGQARGTDDGARAEDIVDFQ